MPKEKRYLDSFSSADRKNVPMYSGLMAYFPDACAAVAEHSYKGNNKHNPGEPLHHARGKSMDHTDCIIRHVAAGPAGMDGDSLDAVALAWRAFAYCQEVLERKYALTLPENVVDPRAFPETNSLVGPNGEQAPQEVEKPPVEEYHRSTAIREPVTTLTGGVTGAPLDFNPGSFPRNAHQRDIADPPTHKRPNGPWQASNRTEDIPEEIAFKDFDHECVPGN